MATTLRYSLSMTTIGPSTPVDTLVIKDNKTGNIHLMPLTQLYTSMIVRGAADYEFHFSFVADEVITHIKDVNDMNTVAPACNNAASDWAILTNMLAR